MADGAGRLRAVFEASTRPLFVPYWMGGYPDPATCRRLARAVARHADVLELGIPFSDPLADGATIQAAGQRALDAGARAEGVIDLAGELRGGPPVVLMSYVNVVMAAGARAFFEHCARAEVAGVIVPDLPIDEGDDLHDAADRAEVALVPLVAPTTSDERLAAVGRRARAFVYCVSVTGVTGGEVAVDAPLREFLTRARRQIPGPLVVGFGIRGPEHAAAVGALADGVVIASELIRRATNAPDVGAAEREVDSFGAAVVAALEGVPAPA